MTVWNIHIVGTMGWLTAIAFSEQLFLSMTRPWTTGRSLLGRCRLVVLPFQPLEVHMLLWVVVLAVMLTLAVMHAVMHAVALVSTVSVTWATPP